MLLNSNYVLKRFEMFSCRFLSHLYLLLTTDSCRTVLYRVMVLTEGSKITKEV